MILPRGITGFNVPKSLPSIDALLFRADCRDVARSIHGSVTDRRQVIAPGVVSFFAEVLATPSGEVSVVLNKYHPWMGFCRPLELGNCTLDFLDPRRLTPAFQLLNRYTVLSPEVLDLIVTDAMCERLGRGERQQLKYWRKACERPLRLGEVIFNFWD